MTGHGHQPDADEIERLARAALARIPEPFASHLGNVVLIVEEFADRETLERMGIDSRWGLLGLYHGLPIGDKSSFDSGGLPDRIHLYRQPMLAAAVQEDVTPAQMVNHVVVHEVGHHFGLSDDDMHMLEESAD
ncbi:metallopeptidase family protein [Stakelama tenebrarum]|uniref:Metallopeptidase family protein n=1 Tax=Stakelama tenebrarum TaxID=2711215 RepID=A0A6G6Y0J9_9SPHN|nr:metallopeptidase family protein [Sphingosinithalassobacter tenebrarum]QIG78361.1 metallopeptidase family protein [Sphingosinithalassobacter tenebrarum]